MEVILEKGSLIDRDVWTQGRILCPKSFFVRHVLGVSKDALRHLHISLDQKRRNSRYTNSVICSNIKSILCHFPAYHSPIVIFPQPPQKTQPPRSSSFFPKPPDPLSLITPLKKDAMTQYKSMLVNINYQVILRSNNTLKGSIKAQVGEPIEEVKNRVLEKQGIKNQDSFLLPESEETKVTEKVSRLAMRQQAEKRKSIKSATARKMSEDSSLCEVSSMDYDNQAKEFLAVEPQKPPIVRGRVQKCNAFLCCFSSELYLQLNITQLKIYSNSKYHQVQQIIKVNNIKQVRSYRKKRLFFIQLVLTNDEVMDFKFANKNLCKEWMGYIMQAMAFSGYLNEKRTFSKADSFKNFIKSLNEENDTRIVTLDESNEHLNTIYQELPEEKIMRRESKHFIKISEFDIKYKIGKGTFSSIFLAERNNRIYALKQLKKEELLLRNQMKYALTELKTLIKCRKCKYIIPLYYAFQTPQFLYLALENVPTGDLSQHIKDYGVFTPEAALIIITELVFAIEHLHKNRIIYRDLKPENIMLDPKGHIYLIDFGLAKQLDNQDDYAESFLGTPLYLAPQRFQDGGGSINYKSDIYGVGCVFYEMLHGQSPFHSTNYHSLINKIKNDTPDINKALPEDFIFFLRETLEKDPSKRIQTMSKHRLFKGVNWKQIQEKSHKGIKIQSSASKSSSIQINYKLDEDYNEYTFPLKLVSDWQFNHQLQE